MTRIKIKRTNVPNKEPAVCIREGRFHFNAIMCQQAGLEKKEYVIYLVDPDKKEIYFEFLKSNTDADAFKLENRGPSRKRSSATMLINAYPWVKAANKKTFVAKEDGKGWVISAQ